MATYEIGVTDGKTLTNFQAVLNQFGGVAKANRYYVSIGTFGLINNVFVNGNNAIPFRRDLEFLCEQSELPGRAIATQDVRYYGPSLKFPFNTAYNEINLTFICRSEMYEKEFFDGWMNQINPIGSYDFNYKNQYATNIDIFQLSEVAMATGTRSDGGTQPIPRPTYKVTLENAYPTNINPVPMLWAEDNFHRIQVTFVYDRWYRDKKDIENTSFPDTYTTGGVI